MRRKLIVGVAFAAGSLLTLGAPTAFAGEVTGNGKGTPFISTNPDIPSTDVKSRYEVVASECSFSGQDDAPAGGTQTPARVGRFVGIACNGSTGGLGAVKP